MLCMYVAMYVSVHIQLLQVHELPLLKLATDKDAKKLVEDMIVSNIPGK